MEAAAAKYSRDEAAIEKDFGVLKRFTRVYCEKHHGIEAGPLCGECDDFLQYARKRLENCRYDPKPKCKNCKTHCYKPSYRAKAQEIMRFSGMHFIKRGRIDWVFKYFF